jgi:RsiW-degrading membrane proteinase PrsW (M82 family)
MESNIDRYEANWLDIHHLGFLNLVVYALLPHHKDETAQLSSPQPLKLEEINTLWPRPWLYLRVLLIFALSFAMLYTCWRFEGKEESSTLLPGLTMIGALAFPLSMLIFFFELNKFRSVSLLHVLRYMLIGSCVSIAITFFFQYALDYLPDTRFYYNGHNYFTPIIMIQYGMIPMLVNAVIEEFGKTLVIFVFLMHYRRRCYILQGMLIGAAVGAGFSVFESAGYAMIGMDNLLDSILMRSFMSPICHIAWGAMIGGGTMMISHRKLSYFRLFNPIFSLLFLFVCSLHFIWNYLLENYLTLNSNIELSIFTLFIILLMIWMGLRQIVEFKRQGFLPVER